VTRVCPDYAPAYYFLGYAYINGGQYKKAELVWKKFLELSKDADEEREEIKEIRERVASLEDPVKIEEGVNLLTAGHLEDGLRILERYVGTEYDSWWPLHYYLASAYRELGFFEESIEGFKRVLALQPSHEESCECLAELYMAEGDADNAEKYRRKAEIIRKNRE
jgi:tetratricopeptide (TPR) repeat protein